MAGGLTLAVMVRDDAKRLDRCLASAKDFVDEIVVLDTGSRDNGVEVARSHGARVHEIEWPGHFSEALNVLLGTVQTAWTLRLDSDEWLDPDQANEVRKATQASQAAAYSLVRRDLRQGPGFDEIDTLRLWRTHDKVRYRGAVHENIPPEWIQEAFPGMDLMRSLIYFWHDGYTTDVEGKMRRNIELLSRELEEQPDNVDLRAMLATTLHGSEDPRSREHLRKLADYLVSHELEAPGSRVSLAIAMFFDSLSDQEAQEEQTKALIQKAVRWYPKTPAVLYFAAITERKRGDLQAALKYLLKLEARVELGDYDRSTPVPAELVGERLWNALGFVASNLGRPDIADRAGRRLAMSRAGRR